MKWHHTAGACLLIIAGVVVAGCSLLFKNPNVSVSTVTPTSLSLSAINLNVTIFVDNPNPTGIPFKKIASDAWFHDGNNWNAITHGEQGAIEVKPGKTELTIPVSVRYTDLFTAGWSILSRRELPLKVNGTASPDLFGMAPELPFFYVEYHDPAGTPGDLTVFLPRDLRRQGFISVCAGARGIPDGKNIPCNGGSRNEEKHLTGPGKNNPERTGKQ